MGNSRKLTEEDYNNLAYFIKEKGDIERWVSWEEKKPLFFKKYPELEMAMNQKKAANKLFYLTLESVLDDSPEEEY